MVSENLRRRAARNAGQEPAPSQEVVQRPQAAVVAQAGGRYAEVQTFLSARSHFVAEALGRRMDVQMYLASVMAAVRKDPNIAQATLPSLMGAVVFGAQLGLQPGPLGQLYLTPRRNSVRVDGQWQKVWEVVPVIGYRGYLALAHRSTGLAVDADARCMHDKWVYQRGTEPRLITAPPDEGPRGEVLGYWAAATWPGGGMAMQYLSNEELVQHADRYVGRNERGEFKGFAGTNWDAWSRKTAIRQLTWRLPQSVDLARAVQGDEATTVWQDESAQIVTVSDAGDVLEVSEPSEAEPAAEQAPPGVDPETGEFDPTADPDWGKQS